MRKTPCGIAGFSGGVFGFSGIIGGVFGFSGGGVFGFSGIIGGGLSGDGGYEGATCVPPNSPSTTGAGAGAGGVIIHHIKTMAAIQQIDATINNKKTRAIIVS